MNALFKTSAASTLVLAMSVAAPALADGYSDYSGYDYDALEAGIDLDYTVGAREFAGADGYGGDVKTEAFVDGVIDSDFGASVNTCLAGECDQNAIAGNARLAQIAASRSVVGSDGGPAVAISERSVDGRIDLDGLVKRVFGWGGEAQHGSN